MYRDIRYITDGEPVTAGVVNRPIQELDGNVRWLKAILDDVAAGKALQIQDAPLDADVLVGQPVYWHATNARYEQAIADTVVSNTGSVTPAPSAVVVGICSAKATGTTGTVTLWGQVPLALTNSVTGTVTAGVYYLSPQTEGKLTRVRPGSGVPVLFADGAGNVFVCPHPATALTEHSHWRVELNCRPAGVTSPPATTDDPHTITEADDALEGWLPISHERFAGIHPAGAKFGYNLSAHPELAALWPPRPLSGAHLIWDRGSGGTVVATGTDGHVILDRHGIWWMTDYRGEVPWPLAFDNSSTSSSSIASSLSSASSSSIPYAPRQPQVPMTLHVCFSQVAAETAQSFVTSLSTPADSPIRFVNCNGDPAIAGDLKALLDLGLGLIGDDATGYMVVKNATGNQLERGPVVGGVGTESSGVLINGQHAYERNGVTYKQGDVTINLAAEVSTRSLIPAVTMMDDADNRVFHGVPGHALPKGRSATVSLLFHVPPAGLPASPRFRLRLNLLGTTTGTLPSLTCTYRRLQRPADVGAAGARALPTSSSALAMTTNYAVGTADNYLETQSSAVVIAAGDSVLVTINRGASDGYSGDVGLLRMDGIVEAA